MLAFDLCYFEELNHDVVVIASVDLRKGTDDVAKAWFSRRYEVLPALDEFMRTTCIARKATATSCTEMSPKATVDPHGPAL